MNASFRSRCWFGVACATLGLAWVAPHWRQPAPATDQSIVIQTRSLRSRAALKATANHEFGMAVKTIAADPSSPERDLDLVHAMRQWAAVDAEQAMRWLDRFPAGEQRDWLACAIATEIASTDPTAAITFMEAQLGEGLPRDHAVVGIAQRWAQQAPAQARRWAEALAGTARGDALREIAAIEAHALSESVGR